jgi:nicotinamidase-related amidase
MGERLRRHGVDPYCQPGTEGIEFFPGLEPPAGEEVITKHRFDAFFGTDLDDRLRSWGIRTVIVLGVATHRCARWTSASASWPAARRQPRPGRPPASRRGRSGTRVLPRVGGGE